MEIVNQKNHEELLRYLPYVKLSIQDWLFVDVRLTDLQEAGISIEKAAESVHALFKSREGKIYVCNEQEILMIVRWGKEMPASIVADSVGKALPEKGCQIFVQEPTMGGIAKLEILITYKKPVLVLSPADIRATRRENIVMVADDDMYMRLLVRKGLGPQYSVIEIADGKEITESYQKTNPDILLLDIHMPNMNGTNVLQEVLKKDPKAFVVMLSADSSRENVQAAAHKGAKGFLTKPFSREKLQEYVNKCPTIF